MDQRIIDLYDQYTHAPLDRRTFLERLAGLTGSMAAASALLPLLQANKAVAAQIAADDARLTTERVAFPKTSRDASHWPVSSRWLRTSFPRRAARRRTKTPRAK
jgi:carboxymethylenebutenolidase